MKHPVLDYLLISAACEVNDKHNQKMLAEGRRIPWWKRHLLLTILLALASPLLIVGAFIILANVLPMSSATALGTFLGWAIPIALLLWGIVAYHRAEKRWRQQRWTISGQTTGRFSTQQPPLTQRRRQSPKQLP